MNIISAISELSNMDVIGLERNSDAILFKEST